MAPKKIMAFAAAAWTLLAAFAAVAAPAQPREWAELSSRRMSRLGQRALESDGPWTHAESAHFIFHYVDAKTAAAVIEHAEFTYEWVRQALGAPEAPAAAEKPRLFVFEDEKKWRAFAARDAPGENPDAFTNGSELFLWRNPAWLEPKRTLAHEVAHVVLIRFFDGPLPLFLHEGIAEYVGYRALARHLGVSEYDFRYVAPIEPGDWIELDELVSMTGYPPGRSEVFYRQSEWVVRFLAHEHERGLLYRLLASVAAGEPFERALREIYGYTWEDFQRRLAAHARAGDRRRSG